MDKDEYVMVEDKSVYDGWCCRYYPDTKEFEWRDHWAIDKLTQRKKNEMELSVLSNWT